MRKETKRSLILGAMLIGIGLVLMAAALTVGGIGGLSTSTFVTNTYEITGDIRDLDILVGTADVVLVPSEDGVCKVVCHEEEKLFHSVTVRDSVLEIRRVDERTWHDFVGIHIGSMQVTVYLPQAEYGNLVIDGSTGHVDIPGEFSFETIDVEVDTGNVHDAASASDSIRIRTGTGSILLDDITVGSMELTASTGRIDAEKIRCDGELKVHTGTGSASLTKVICGTLSSEGTTGRISLTEVAARERMELLRSTGDVELADCDAPVIVIETNTGDVTGSLLTGKLFETHTSTGDIQIPKSTSGGECRITTSTGDIRIVIE